METIGPEVSLLTNSLSETKKPSFYVYTDVSGVFRKQPSTFLHDN